VTLIVSQRVYVHVCVCLSVCSQTLMLNMPVSRITYVVLVQTLNHAQSFDAKYLRC